jgi:class 3 adenylate cyclase
MELKLVVRHPELPPAEYVVESHPLVVGRDPACDIQIASNYVSRRHFQVEPAGEEFRYVDLGGRNPVLLNGKPIEDGATLVPGDSLSIADVYIDVAGDAVFTGTVVFVPKAAAPKAVAAPPPPPPVVREAPPVVLGGPPERAGTAPGSGIHSVWQGQQLGPGGTLTIMFTDLEKSTNMVTELGEREAYRVMTLHNSILRAQFQRFRGYEAKRVGDGFLVLFASARDAMHCAVAIQRNLANAPIGAFGPIRVRIGIHVGEVIWDENDIFGSAVNYSARVMSEAQGTEILISPLLKEMIAISGEFTFGEDRLVPLKGFKGEHRLSYVLWAEDQVPN